MSFWIYWDQGFQAFTVLIGVSLIWLRFIEPLFSSRGLAVTLMIVIALALALLKFFIGIGKIRKEHEAARKQIEAMLAVGEDAL